MHVVVHVGVRLGYLPLSRKFGISRMFNLPLYRRGGFYLLIFNLMIPRLRLSGTHGYMAWRRACGSLIVTANRH